ncbi:hypothetical protein [Clostridium sp.]|jgi:hypothetical protein|uniref:hypothetical protein n=1 Tax=Clostridium sp. TaxID=1506 RepID=UPI00205AF032|nr:hypothetical protein [Clostridium sp.]MDU7212511.1 hypothetical protein [Clostridium sp.]DAE86119.1 MAG TPA: hypothetical protein [Caudoviricetes sp.]
MSKFKVGNKVTGVNLNQCMYGKKARVIKIVNFCGMTGYILDEFPVIKWWEDELKLIEPATEEFTFEEVIARIKEGEVYQNSLSSISKIDGCIEVVSINRSGRTIPKGEEYIVRFETNNYKLVPKKNNYLLFVVEHKEGGKRYLFRSDLDHTLDDMVVCDTCQGKSYGKMIKVVTKELTEEEYKQYKPIVKIISKGCPF